MADVTGRVGDGTQIPAALDDNAIADFSPEELVALEKAKLDLMLARDDLYSADRTRRQRRAQLYDVLDALQAGLTAAVKLLDRVK